jgi:hypothetical protein
VRCRPGRRTTNTVSTQNSTTSTISALARRQLMNTVSGSSTRVAMKVANCSRKKLSHTQNMASAPDSMVFISRPDCASPWNDSGSDSTCS